MVLGLITLVLIFLVSALFFVYVSSFSSYSATYGPSRAP
jgi:uncharacterized BrkB/YihY/UPF0761 family membrane protein